MGSIVQELPHDPKPASDRAEPRPRAGRDAGRIRREAAQCEGYVPVRGDETPKLEAQSTCQERAKFRDGRGLEWVNWNEFATCMKKHGYRKP